LSDYNQVSFLRHNAFFAPEDSSNVYFNIIGVGATGSWAGLLAAKMGWTNFRIWDLDIVESHNCPNQIYGLHQVGLKKVDAFEQSLKAFNPNVVVEKYDCFFESKLHQHLLEDAVFVAVDTLSARKDIISSIKNNYSIDIVFETSMGFEHANLNTFTPSDVQYIDSYLSLLKEDHELPESACNARIITTLTNIVASTLVHTLCAYYAYSRTQKPCTLVKKQLFSFSSTQNLNIYNF
jgi:hypothetical protein